MATTSANRKNGETRKVYVIERKEVVSHSFYVIASSRNEALQTFEEEECDHGYDSDIEFCYGDLEDSNDYDRKVFLIDGSHEHHRYMKPKVERSFIQMLIQEAGSSVKKWLGGDY